MFATSKAFYLLEMAEFRQDDEDYLKFADGLIFYLFIDVHRPTGL